jgi:hypothetical protein
MNLVKAGRSFVAIACPSAAPVVAQLELSFRAIVFLAQ